MVYGAGTAVCCMFSMLELSLCCWVSGVETEYIVVLSCRKRTKRVKEVQEKLQKLEESAGLLQQRVMFERALCWVAVEDVQQQIAQLKRQLEVRCQHNSDACFQPFHVLHT